MPRIARESVLTLEAYARERKAFRERVLAHKKPRAVPLGEHVTLLFEDELTMRYQIQEMLHAERIFEEAGIQDELDAYNPLIPDGHNWKATLQVEYEDLAERRQALAQLRGIEDRVWVQVAGQPRVLAIADEDMERDNVGKTSAVHFVRFELTPPMVTALKAGAGVAVGVDHPHYSADARPGARADAAGAARRSRLGQAPPLTSPRRRFPTPRGRGHARRTPPRRPGAPAFRCAAAACRISPSPVPRPGCAPGARW